MQYKLFNKWLGFLSLNIAASGILWYQGIFSLLLASDITFLSVAILGIYFLTTLSLGIKSYKLCTRKVKRASRDDYKQNLNYEWYIRSEIVSLGLVGTIIGLMFVLGPAFASIDPNSAASITEAINFITLGAGTALWTTVTALISSILLSIQLMEIEKEQDNV